MKPRIEENAKEAAIYTTAVGGKLTKVAHEVEERKHPIIPGGSDPTDKKKGLTIKQLLKTLQEDVKKIE